MTPSVVLVGTHQSFFLELLELLIPGASLDPELEAELAGLPPPCPSPPPAFHVAFASAGEEGLSEVRRMRTEGSAPELVFVDAETDPDGSVVLAAQLAVGDPRAQIILCAGQADAAWAVRCEALGHAEQIALLARPWDGVEVRALAHRLDETSRAQRCVGAGLTAPTPLEAGLLRVAREDPRRLALQNAFRAIHGLVDALGDRLSELEPLGAAAETHIAFDRALEGLHRIEGLVGAGSDRARRPVAAAALPHPYES